MTSRNAKAAHAHYFGDFFEPKAPTPIGGERFSPLRYIAPHLHSHRWRDKDGWHDDWHNDINYRYAGKYGHPPRLVANPRWTFNWTQPMIHFPKSHCRNYSKWPSLHELLAATAS